MRKTLFLTAAAAAMMWAQHSLAGEIVITGRFDPGFATGFVDSNFDSEIGDTSGDQFGDLIDFSIPANFATPKTLSFDTPVYGDLQASFFAFDYIRITVAGLFYELRGATGFLDVNIVNPGFGISSFMFTDVATAPAPVEPPPVIDPPPPACVIDCGGGVTPPPTITGTPETSTWLMMLLGFASLGYAGLRRSPGRAIASR
jgi:hypothetical protein